MGSGRLRHAAFSSGAPELASAASLPWALPPTLARKALSPGPLLRAGGVQGDTDWPNSQPSPAALTGAPTLLLGVHGTRLLLFFLPPRSLLSLNQGLVTAGEQDQHAAALGWHHILQQPQLQELQRTTRQFATSAFPLSLTTKTTVCISPSLVRFSTREGRG